MVKIFEIPIKCNIKYTFVKKKNTLRKKFKCSNEQIRQMPICLLIYSNVRTYVTPLFRGGYPVTSLTLNRKSPENTEKLWKTPVSL